MHHPEVEITHLHSRSQSGKAITTVHHDLFGETDLHFTDEIPAKVDVLYLCMGHGESSKFLEQNKIPDSVKIIDLSQDFRWANAENKNFVYGLPEAFRDDIRSAENVANPGCFATSIQLALLPLAAKKKLNDDIHISGITGSTGAGQSPSATTHYSWRSSNVSLYKAFKHQHLMEIGKTLSNLQPNFKQDINFVPMRGNFTRGILIAAYTKTNLDLTEAKEIYQNFYQSHPFVFISENNPDIKQVINSNKCLLYLEKHEDNLLIVSIIDNLIKGASGQAVQNMNLLFDLNESSGLKLKPVAF